MNMPSVSTLSDALLDVRSAYRLLYEYQRRVLDLVRYIGDAIGLHFADGESWLSHLADEKSGPQNWAWDWLGMYHYEFRFRAPGTLRFSVVLVSDTGYFDTNASGVPQPLKPEVFASPELSETKLILMIGREEYWVVEAEAEDQQRFAKLKMARNYETFKRPKKRPAVFVPKFFALSAFIDIASARQTLKLKCPEKEPAVFLAKPFAITDFMDDASARQALKVFLDKCDKQVIKDLGLVAAEFILRDEPHLTLLSNAD